MWSQVEEVKSDGGTTDEEGLTVSGRRKYHIYIISRFKESIMCVIGIEKICPKDHYLASQGLLGDDKR